MVYTFSHLVAFLAIRLKYCPHVAGLTLSHAYVIHFISPHRVALCPLCHLKSSEEQVQYSKILGRDQVQKPQYSILLHLS